MSGYGWSWLTQAIRDRQVNSDGTANWAIRDIEIAVEGSIVHLRGYGYIKVFKIIATNGIIEYRATNDCEIDEATKGTFSRRGHMKLVYEEAKEANYNLGHTRQST